MIMPAVDLPCIIQTEPRIKKRATPERTGKMEENKKELNTENLENAAGGTPMSIPGGKRSGRGNSEAALDIMNKLEDWGTAFRKVSA